MEYCILGDIGGTKCKLLLMEFSTTKPYNKKTILTKSYVTNDYGSLEEILEIFLQEYECEQKRPKFCSLAIAGPVINNKIEEFANMNWSSADGNSIRQKFNFVDCVLLNDFEAVGYSAASMKFEEFYSIQKSKNNEEEKGEDESSNIKPNKHDDYLVIGQGTGMGVVYIKNQSSEDNFKALPSEAGHLPLGIHNDFDYRLQNFIKKKLGKPKHSYVGQEYFLCGRGIPWLYEFLMLERQLKCEEELDSRKVLDLLTKENPLTKEFFDIYLDYYGRSIDNLIKAFLPKGGNIVLGGIIFLFFKKFFNLNNKLFFKKFKKYYFRENAFIEIFKDINIYIFSNNIADFGLEGSFNYITLKSLPITSGFNTKSIQTEIEDIPFTIYSKNLNQKFITLKGFLENIKKGIFLVKVKSHPLIKKMKINGAERLMKCYMVESLECHLKLITPLKGVEYYPDDIVKLIYKDQIYFTPEDGWYFYNKVSSLVFICSDEFDDVSKLISKKDKISSSLINKKLQMNYFPLKVEFKETRDFNLSGFLKLNHYTKKIETNKFFFKIINNQHSSVFRYDKYDAENFRMVIMQCNKILFKALVPEWTPVPKEPFYAYLTLEMLFAPGFKKHYFLVLYEQNIFSSNSTFEDQFLEETQMIDVEEIALNQFPYIFK